MVEKIKILVRFANESTYYNTITVDPTKIENPMIFRDEVFVDIDGVRVAMKREDWDKIENETSR